MLMMELQHWELSYIMRSNGFIGINTNTPASVLHIAGSVSTNFASVSSNTTLDSTHYTVRATVSGITLTLPTASDCTGRIYCIINYNTGGNISISAFLSPVAVSTTTISNGSTVWIQSDGNNWFQIK